MAVNSVADLAGRMRKVGEAAVKARKISLQRAAFAMKAAHLTELSHDAPGGRLRNVGKNGARLGVKYTLHGDDSAIVEATGPWQILNNPAKPHLIAGRKSGILRLADGSFRKAIHHPGHRGKQTWQHAQPKAAEVATKELNRQMTIAVQQAFKG